jgi:hypothetical protein
VNLESTYDCEGSQWTVPAKFTYSKVTRVGDQLVSWAAGARYYFEAPDSGPEWGLRFVFHAVLPALSLLLQAHALRNRGG